MFYLFPNLLWCRGCVDDLLYFFVHDFWFSETVNNLGHSSSLVTVIMSNTFALLLFGIQHSVMARPTFKGWFTRYIDPSIERSTYILATSAAITGMCYLWIPFGSVIWKVESEIGVYLIYAVAVFGWVFLFLATFMINHFELFGLRQTFDLMQGKLVSASTSRITGFYKIVRHPIQTGILVGLWAVPISTSSHQVFAAGMSIYIFIGLYFEEKDSIQEFGEAYVDYMKRFKRVIPFIV